MSSQEEKEKQKKYKKSKKVIDKRVRRVLYKVQIFEKYFVQMFGEPK